MQEGAVLSKASRLSKDLKIYPRMEVSSKDMKIEVLSKDINCYPRIELSSKDIRKVHYIV